MPRDASLSFKNWTPPEPWINTCYFFLYSDKLISSQIERNAIEQTIFLLLWDIFIMFLPNKILFGLWWEANFTCNHILFGLEGTRHQFLWACVSHGSRAVYTYKNGFRYLVEFNVISFYSDSFSWFGELCFDLYSHFEFEYVF